VQWKELQKGSSLQIPSINETFGSCGRHHAATTVRTGKQWTSSDDHWRQPRSRAQVHKAKRVTRCSGVRRKLRALANPLESHPYATRACNPRRITFLRKTMGRGYRPATTNSSIPGEPPGSHVRIGRLSLPPTFNCRLLPVASHRCGPGAPICTNCPAATGGGAIGFGFNVCFPRQLSNIPTCCTHDTVHFGAQYFST